ncbi:MULTISPECIES: hypothetical protein [Aliivibrio]|uniref:Uncharacterized protein n=1 Tax=Aliivibrio finisterrensis TaxID=511998 RepID=A0A4Q5KXW6_9GAMM|nr:MULTISPECIES: hypothetical protein [Aliivibrio]MDD9177240.1 hypothetical protein [Aliivibrio sp. A6]RYU51861.1 hypothetical protein ERW56_11845 [Aliivibrio finisterrensis]RYU54731.1 hypothetical protein ERW57_00315 [Aliivibrio finisterrensis]RYU57663.1 hypothetical protein ERW50_11255 [Aliivibrio finisterrensis]RYU66886.1 hypothetical protein ERW53_01855 [Aliivibrio finisterrensis]
MTKKVSKDDLIAVERYKFILEKIKYLDSLHQIHFAVIYKVLTALISFIIIVIFSGIEEKIKPATVEFSVQAAGMILIFTCLFFFAMSCAILSSWRDYRIEEVDFLSTIDTKVERKLPSSDISWRWNEIQFIALLITLCLLGVIIFMYPKIITNLF